MSYRRRDFIRFLLVALILALCGSVATYRISQFNGLAALRATSEQRLAAQSAMLERVIDKFRLLPLSAALDREIIDFLKAPNDPAGIDAINHHLQTLNGSAGTLQTYLIDPSGLIIASSNFNGPDSFIGRNISYRPYFQFARPGHTVDFYAVGTTRDVAGYFLATEVVGNDGRRLGVIAIKIGLEQLEAQWSNSEQPVLLTDENHVVVLASSPQWRFGVIGDISAEEAHRLNDTQQYNRRPLRSLHWREVQRIANDVAIVRLGDGVKERTYLAVSSAVSSIPSMRLTILSDPAEISALAWAYAFLAALAIGLAAAIVNALNQRRVHVRDRLAAREALQRAHDRLEIQVEERSAELRAANEDLRREVAERIQDAKRLQSFQNELIRTENLAVIGQLSAGLAHELNQPLAALSTLSANAIRFLEQDDLATVKFNLSRICDLVARMGTLTGQLRSFARRSTGEAGEVPVLAAIDSAIALLSHRLTKDGVVLELRAPPTPVKVICEIVRLEQVLVNLISNAVDACPPDRTCRVLIAWRADNGRALIEVSDNGTGLAEDVIARVFEPFFTTKTKSGLGLGLAISADIIKGFGGTLTAANTRDGGACFTIDLPAAEFAVLEERQRA